MHGVPTLVLRTFTSPIELRTPRVLLRQWKDSDIDAWAAMNADPEVRRFFPAVLNRAEAQAEADRIRASITQRGWGMWALEIPGVHPFSGFVGLSLPGYEAPWMPAVEIGWRQRPGTRATPPKAPRPRWPSRSHTWSCRRSSPCP